MASPAAESVPVPWDTSSGNRFAHYSTEDHSAPLWIAAALSFTYVLGILFVRLYLKWRLFGWDDFLILVSTASSVLQSILIFKALDTGVGKLSAQATDISLAGKLVFSSRILLILSLYLAKLSILFLLRRIFIREQRMMAFLCNATIGFTVLAGLVSILTVSVGCPTSTFFAQHCHDQVAKWTTVTALDGVTEGLAFLLPVFMVWTLQTRVQTKLRVIAAFGFRLVAIAPCALHLSAWSSYTNGGPSTFAVVPTLVWQQALVTTSLITATIPNLKTFLQTLSASWGGAQFGYTTKAYGNGTFEMHNVASIAPSVSQTSIRATYSTRSQAGFKTQVTTSVKPFNDQSSLGSGDSQDLIIRKETVFTVERS